MSGKNTLLSAGAMVFSIAAIVLVFLKFRSGIGPGLIVAGPFMALASICHGLRIWNSDRKRAALMLVMAAACAAVGIYFAVI